jgi:hypothetical protein
VGSSKLLNSLGFLASGWTTTISKEGGKYKKTATRESKRSGSAVDAEKVK